MFFNEFIETWKEGDYEVDENLINKVSDEASEILSKCIDPKKNESEQGYNNFTVIQNKIESIDWLYLSYSGHKRLSINFKNNMPEFSWLIP